MKRVRVRVPLRVDLAGGTLDLWPLHLFHPGARTVNVAISTFAECEVSTTGDGTISVFLTDQGLDRSYGSIAELSADPDVALLARVLEHVSVTGIRIVTRTEAPRGSGLGGSSALTIALVRALTELVEQPVEGEELIHLVRDIETRLLGIPAGVQDYYPPVYGGLATLHLQPGKVRRASHALSLSDLSQHLVVYYSGIAHFSGTNNWEIYKRHVDGDREIVDGLARIAETAVRMDRAIEIRDLEAAGAAMADEWAIRKALISGITNEEIDGAIEAATTAGAWGGKVCGAGGGGCVVFLCPADRRDAVVSALAQRSGKVLGVAPVPHGLVIDTELDAQKALPFSRRGHVQHSDAEVEQLFVASGSDRPWTPWVLAEAAITYDEPRIGVHLRRNRTMVAPLDIEAERVDWTGAVEIDPETLELVAAPEASASIPPLERTVITKVDGEGRETLLESLLQTERLSIFHNAALQLYGQPGESREEFLSRCRELALRTIEDESHRLESTYRRRIDQMKERSQRDQRERESQEEMEPTEIRRTDVAISWGQTLYKITKSRPASTGEPQSMDEADYVQKIALLQQQWERELEARREEEEIRARAIEDVTLIPSRRNIELTRYVILWSRGTPRSTRAVAARE